jgi:tetratricopeptide (TPR) repeat protein
MNTNGVSDLAQQLNEAGRAAAAAGRRDEAVAAYERAIAAAPRWDLPLYNLGLLYKYEQNWPLSLECNQRAFALDAGNEAAIWNLGIAATALGNWAVARKAWRDFGIEVPNQEGAVDLACGTGPIRIRPGGDAEIVWAKRIDPARAILLSIPYAESGHGWRDLVLNDGAPNGHRVLNGQELPVFDELEHLERSIFGTFVAGVTVREQGLDPDRLCEIADALDGAAEDWTTSVRLLCKQCSEGRPHVSHDQANALPQQERTIAVAALSHDHANQILLAWQKDRVSRLIP